jgi:MFS family permease
MVLWTSQVVSTVGMRVSTIAYPLLVLALTGSPAAAGVVAFAQTAPYLVLYLPAGAYVDRWDRRRTMLVCEAGRTLVLATVAISASLGVASVPLLAVLAFIEGSLFVFFDLCEGAALPRIVPAEQLPAAIAQNQARTQGADLVGQPLGGILFGLGREFPFAFHALGHAVSFAAILSIRKPLQEARAAAPGRLRSAIAEGLRTVWRQAFLRASVLLIAGQNFAWSALVLVLIVRAQALGAGPELIGLMFGIMGAGAIAGALVAPWIRTRVRIRPLVVGISWLWAALVALMAVLPDVLAIGGVMGLASVGGPVVNVAIGNAVYEATPDRLLGRVRSVAKAIAWSAIPPGSLAAGLLAAALGGQLAIVTLAVVLGLTAVAASVSSGLRDDPRRLAED